MKFSRNPKSKYRNTVVLLDGVRFASKREAARYMDLKMLARIGEIQDLELQPRFKLVVNEHHVCTYVADFRYIESATGVSVVEDVKSPATVTPVYRVKKKLLLATHGITVREIL